MVVKKASKKQKDNFFLLFLSLIAVLFLTVYLLSSKFSFNIGSSASSERRRYPKVTVPPYTYPSVKPVSTPNYEIEIPPNPR